VWYEKEDKNKARKNQKDTRKKIYMQYSWEY